MTRNIPENEGGLSRLSRAQRDLDDLQNELAGRSTGRATRFFNENSGGDTAKGKERRLAENERFMSALRRAMLNPAYAQKYEAFDRQLRRAEEATVSVLMILTKREEEAREALDRLRDRANTLEDGSHVYRTKDGSKAYTERGRLLTGEEMASIAWSDDAPSWEDHEEQRARLERIEAERGAVIRYQEDVLDPARERMSDEDNPPSVEELDAMTKKLEGEAPRSIKAYRDEGEDFDLDAPAADPASEHNAGALQLPPVSPSR